MQHTFDPFTIRLRDKRYLNWTQRYCSYFKKKIGLFLITDLFQTPNKDEDVFHFVGYIPIDGRLYELDGLKDGPIDLGAVGPDQEWLNVVRPIIEERMQKYSEGEIHFNLMALVSDRQVVYQRQIEKLQSGAIGESDQQKVKNEISRLRMLIDDDITKKKRYKVK